MHQLRRAHLPRLGTPLPLVPPILGDLATGAAQPVAVRRQPNQLDGGKPFRRVGSRIAKRCQFTNAQQNLEVMRREAQELRCGGRIQAGWKSPDSPRCQSCFQNLVIHIILAFTNDRRRLALGAYALKQRDRLRVDQPIQNEGSERENLDPHR